MMYSTISPGARCTPASSSAFAAPAPAVLVVYSSASRVRWRRMTSSRGFAPPERRRAIASPVFASAAGTSADSASTVGAAPNAPAAVTALFEAVAAARMPAVALTDHGSLSGSVQFYRAATKAGVNAIMKSLALDLARRGIIAVPVHPGWAATDMGGPNAPVRPQHSVAGLRQVIAGLSKEKSGRFWQWDGKELPW